ncbi:MAG: DUF3343 domain-containing protein [Lachnospiraceae bacterium]|nr:DUF3343 domain-containing protein [Lachnospiraceae bacterium]
MTDYIVTFFSHFGAMRYKKEADNAGLDAVLMPVPRYLSSSCGTCVKLRYADGAADPNRFLPVPSHPDEIEMVVRMTGEETYIIVSKN